ncbi:MAG: bifunctional riboflavin kinase/FAD synthetase [Cellvibrionales bacterium]|jgi:riboflavin kinase/FMN adenylyltransferase|nr:bifunctional riboflavin kinase/FAD synthetase [Cellvibrionales bacterium]
MPFTLIRGLHNLRPQHRGCVATIGSFDGVHRGHRAIIDQLLVQAKALSLPSVVMIFEPQPYEFFSGEKAPARLTPMREKVRALAACGVDRVICLQFNQALRQLTAQAFIEQVLVEGLGIKSLVVGDDFRFGCDRTGDFALLQQAGKQHGFSVYDTCTVEEGGERISSTRIRHALETEHFAEAECLLGHAYTVRGRVEYGRQLGRTIGVPTANVRLRRYRSPLNGVFAVRMRLADSETWMPGVANVGVRPTVGHEIRPILEVYVLDFSGDLYRREVEVIFCKKLREERKFPSFDALKEQIYSDIAQAKQFFEMNS